MAFNCGDRVFVTSGRHKGRHGKVIATKFANIGYKVQFDLGDIKWFPCWVLDQSFPTIPRDNESTMRNARAALDIIRDHEQRTAMHEDGTPDRGMPSDATHRKMLQLDRAIKEWTANGCPTADQFITVHDTTELDIA